MGNGGAGAAGEGEEGGQSPLIPSPIEKQRSAGNELGVGFSL